MPVPFPGFYQLLLVLLGFAGCMGGAQMMVHGSTQRRQKMGYGLFLFSILFIAAAVILGKAGVG